MTQTATAPQQAPTSTEPHVLSVVRRRLLPLEQRLDPYAWLAALAVTFLAGVLRLYNLARPPGKIFDETYYATDAHWLWEKGFEWDEKNNTAGYVVHPPLGKWIIGLGEQVLGYHEVGWRLAAAVFGTVSVLMFTRIAMRMFGSVVLGCAAGVLMAFDGMHFVLSRTALLDIFLMFFLLAAFGALVLDRDQRRLRWLRFVENGGDPAGRGRAARPPFAVPWWRLAAAVMLGCALGVKWSALAFAPVFVLLVLWWEVGARRAVGVRHPIRDAILDEGGWVLAAIPIVLGVYVATWSGWILNEGGYYRDWSPSWLSSLIHYHEEALKFHEGLSSEHTYQSVGHWAPIQWLLLGRPVAFYWSGDPGCGVEQCAAEVLLLGTPLLWWSFLPAIGATIWFGIARRDWRAGAILAMTAFALVPWFFFPNRTMFYFYALPAEPFLILAVVFVFGAIMTAPPGKPLNENRQLIGSVLFGAFVLLVVINFALFYPIYVGESIPYVDWNRRMLLGNLWI